MTRGRRIPKTLTATEAAGRLRVSRDQVGNYMRRKDDPLVFFRVEKKSRWLIYESDFKKWHDRQLIYSDEYLGIR